MAKSARQLSFTTSSEGKVNSLINEIQIALPIAGSGNLDKPPQPNLIVKAIWDTGAKNLVITQNVADKLGLVPTGQIPVNGVHGTKITDIYRVSFVLPNRVFFGMVHVSKAELLGNNIHALIGMDIISQGDFAITHKDNKTKFSFSMPALAHIDFTDLQNSYLYPQYMNRAERRNNNKQAKKSVKRNQKFKR